MRRAGPWLAIAVLAMAAPPVSAPAATPPWSEPVDVATEALAGTVGIDRAGRITAVWSTLEQRAAFVATRRPGARRFDPAVTLGPGLMPDLAVADSGEALVTWSEPDPACTPSTVICRQRAFMRARGVGASDFGAARTLTEEAIDRPALAMNQSGDAVVAWTSTDGAVRAALRPAGGRLGRARVLAPGRRSGLPPRPVVAIGESGAAVVAWMTSSGTPEPLVAVYRPAGGSFGRPEDGSDGVSAFAPVAAMSARGTATLAFSPTGGGFLVADRLPNGRFQIVEDMGGAAGAVNAGFTQDVRGNQLVYWVEQTGFSMPPAFQARAAFRDLGDPWTSAISILPPNSFPTLQLDRLGNAHALWWTDPFQGQHVVGGTLTRFGILENTQDLTTISGVVDDVAVNRAGAVAALISEFRDRTSPTGGPAVRLVTKPADRSAADVELDALVGRTSVVITAQCDEACRLNAALTSGARAAGRRGAATVTLRAGRRATVPVPLTRAGRARLRRGMAITLRVTAVDAGGNIATLSRRLRR